MPLAPGTRLGPYEIAAAIGEGGMGQVYRARDTALNRDVAIKVLPDTMVDDPERLMRFEREAQALAGLNHPNIAQIYGLEKSGGGPAIVMELVEGQTLQELLRQTTSLPSAQALTFAKQIANALDAAHEQGIIHRDLKPANICVADDGAVKVLDFGLAKLAPSPEENRADTTTMATGTVFGSVLGTPGYMSPEQARGLAVDRRTDIWAFGCVLFELWAGQSPFAGETVSDRMAAVLEREPDWRTLPAHTPASVRRLIRRCLEKDQRQRLRDIGDAVFELADPLDGRTAGSQTERPNRRLTRALAALAVTFAATSAWQLLAGGDTAQAPTGGPVRFEVSPPAGTRFGSRLSNIETTTIAFSPDSSRLAFIALGDGALSRVWVRALADSEAQPVAGTDGAESVFWSPDSRSLAFFADGKLRRIDPGADAAVTLCPVPVAGLSGTWGVGNDILFASVQGEAIFRVSTAGGTPTAVVNADPERGVSRVLWPSFLPDGRRFIYTALGKDQTGIAMLASLDGGEGTPIVPVASRVQWADPNLLLFVREGTLLGQTFDLAAGRITGEPFSISDPVAYSVATGWAEFSASSQGMLALQSHRDLSRLVWMDRSGKRLAVEGEPGDNLHLRLSADNQRLLFSRSRPELGTYDLWITDLSRQAETRVTSSPGMETGPVWIPGDRAIAFAAATGGTPALTYRNLDTGAERQLLPVSRFQYPNDVTSDGAMVAYQQRTELGNWDLMILPIDNPAAIAPLFNSPFSEGDLRFSPDGRMVTFTSDESGRSEVYIAPYPVTGEKTLVSTGGGIRARWHPDGSEVFYVSSSGHLMAVPVGAGAPRQVGVPKALFTAERFGDYDVALDGRFLVVVPELSAREQPLSVILNWPATIRR